LGFKGLTLKGGIKGKGKGKGKGGGGRKGRKKEGKKI